MIDYDKLRHLDEIDRMKVHHQELQDRLNAWEIWFEDVREALGLSDATGTYATAESTRDVLDAIKDLQDELWQARHGIA